MLPSNCIGCQANSTTCCCWPSRRPNGCSPKQLNRQGVKIERGVELTALTHQRDGVSVVLRSGEGAKEVVDAAYLIAADGSHSAIRKALGLPFLGRSLTHNYVLGDLHIAGDVPEDQLSIFLARNGFLAVFPMGDGRFRFMATDPDRDSGRHR